jgi:hypothetical protein
MPDGKWSDQRFLESLRQVGDPPADRAVERLLADHGVARTNLLFSMLKADDTPLPADAPKPFLEFMESTSDLPSGIDEARLKRGGEVFLRHAFSAAAVLLASSLPRGYAAPCLCEILSISRDLQKHPYDRLMGVLQLLVNISTPAAFKPRGRAIVTAQKLRLLHAGVRTIVPRLRPGYDERHGVPVNQEDRLATIMGFSYLVIEGLRRLQLPLTPDEEEDFYYLWKIFAQISGIHPDECLEDTRWIPGCVAEAGEFYASYVRRQDTGPDKNHYGVVLTQDNLDMMKDLIPKWLRWFGFGAAPRIAMTELLKPEELAKVGLAPLFGHQVVKGLLNLVLHLVQGFEDVVPFSSRLAALLFQDMIDRDREGQVEFKIPVTVWGLRGSALR